MSKINFIFFALGPDPRFNYYVSGGATRELEVVKRLGKRNNVSLWVFASKTVCNIFSKNQVKGYYKKIPDFITFEKPSILTVINSIMRSVYTCLVSLPYLNSSIIVHSPSDFLWDVLPALAQKLKNHRVKWFATVYHIIQHPSKRPGGFRISNLLSFIGQRLSIFLIVKWADIVQTENIFVKNELIRLSMSPNRIVVCPSGINTRFIDNIVLTEGKAYDVCFLARLHSSKGIYDLLEAWKYVCESRKEARLAIAGAGSIEVLNELKYKIKHLGLENNVHILGFLSEEEKYRVLKRSKIYVLPSYEEGIPITFYEAMYCGLPVVTYYLPTYEEIKDYIVSVPLGDVKKLAEEIIRLLEDENLTRKLGDRGREFAKEHTWDKVAECIISQLEKLV
jgi:glycosyltransferase involved in cell wall biosynthesis